MQTIRRRWFWALVAALVFVSIALLALRRQTSTGKVAVINGSVITQEDFDREMDQVRQRISSIGKPLIDSQIPEIHESKVL